MNSRSYSSRLEDRALAPVGGIQVPTGPFVSDCNSGRSLP